MKGFIVSQTYKLVDSKPSVLLFGRLENGESFMTISYHEPYFYIRKKDSKELPKEINFQSTNFKNFDKEEVIKVLAEIPSNVSKLRRSLDVDCYEADIKFPQRFLIDNNIKSSLDIEGEYKQGEAVDRIYYQPTLKPTEFNPELKTLSLDIETSSDGKDLYSVSFYSKNYKESLIITNKKVKALTFKDEESLLEKLQEIIIEQDPDVITGWNVIDFDLLFLQNKFKEHRIPFILGRTNDKCKLRIESDFFRTSKAEFPGRVVLDGIELLKSSFINLPDYKLSTASHHFLKEKKLIGDDNKGEEIEKLYKNNPQKLIDYNLKDSKLVIDILDKSNTLKLAIHRSLITGMTPERVSASIASFDSLYLRKLKEKKLVAPSSEFHSNDTRIKGGFVRDSTPGIYENIIILDFKSLYPSIIQTFNIDPSSFLGKKTKEKNTIKAFNGAYFRNENGPLTEIITELMKEREKVAKKKDELTRYAIKILLNSFFGVMANQNFRFFNIDMANAITYSGQELIKQTAKEVEKENYEVIYSDTDSVFINSKLKDTKKAEVLGKKLASKINTFFIKYIEKKLKRKSHLELEYEKVFKMFLMPKVRGSESGAKKRYAGLIIKDGKEKIEFTGMESKRKDWTEAAQNFQLELLDKIFHKKEIRSYVKKFVDDIKAGKKDKLLIYKKSIRKDLSEYVKITPPHVKAARKLKKLTSNTIEYVLTTDGPEPIQAQKHKIDYDHYINKQIKPIADSILLFFKTDFDEIMAGSKQQSLFNF